MKKLTSIITAGLLAFALSASAQTFTNTSPTIAGGLEQIWTAMGGVAPTNLSVGPYGSAAIKNGGVADWTVGLAAIYNVFQNDSGQSLGAGLAVDYSPGYQEFSLISGQVVFKTEARPFSVFGWNWPVYPYTFAGVGTPMSGSDATGNAAVIVGAGAAFKFVETERIVFGGSAAYANWSNIGDASGPRVYFGLGLKIKVGSSAKSRGRISYFGT